MDKGNPPDQGDPPKKTQKIDGDEESPEPEEGDECNLSSDSLETVIPSNKNDIQLDQEKQEMDGGENPPEPENDHQSEELTQMDEEHLPDVPPRRMDNEENPPEPEDDANDLAPGPSLNQSALAGNTLNVLQSAVSKVLTWLEGQEVARRIEVRLSPQNRPGPSRESLPWPMPLAEDDDVGHQPDAESLNASIGSLSPLDNVSPIVSPDGSPPDSPDDPFPDFDDRGVGPSGDLEPYGIRFRHLIGAFLQIGDDDEEFGDLHWQPVNDDVVDYMITGILYFDDQNIEMAQADEVIPIENVAESDKVDPKEKTDENPPQIDNIQKDKDGSVHLAENAAESENIVPEENVNEDPPPNIQENAPQPAPAGLNRFLNVIRAQSLNTVRRFNRLNAAGRDFEGLVLDYAMVFVIVGIEGVFRHFFFNDPQPIIVEYEAQEGNLGQNAQDGPQMAQAEPPQEDSSKPAGAEYQEEPPQDDASKPAEADHQDGPHMAQAEPHQEDSSKPAGADYQEEPPQDDASKPAEADHQDGPHMAQAEPHQEDSSKPAGAEYQEEPPQDDASKPAEADHQDGPHMAQAEPPQEDSSKPADAEYQDGPLMAQEEAPQEDASKPAEAMDQDGPHMAQEDPIEEDESEPAEEEDQEDPASKKCRYM